MVNDLIEQVLFVLERLVAEILRLLEPLFGLFKHDETAISAALAIVVAAVFVFAWIWLVRMQPRYRALRSVIRFLRRTRGPEAFHAEYQQIVQAFQRHGGLQHAWREFDETLIKPREGEPRIVRNTVRPSVFFNVQAVVESGLNIPLYQAIPNYFVGIGLLLTFLGLVAGLYFAAGGVAGEDVRVAQASLKDLLSAATFKFLTSIVGVLSSILLSLGLRQRIHVLQVLLDNLCAALEERVVFVPAEELAHYQYQELQKQTQQLERFNTDFAVQLAEAIDNRFTASLTTALSPVLSAVNNLSGNLGAQNQQALARMLEDFRSGLHQSTGREIETAAEALSQVRAALQAVIDGVGRSGSDFGEKLDRVAAELGKLIASAGEGLAARVAEATHSLGEAVAPASETVRGLTKTVGELDGRLGKQVTAFDEGLTGFRELLSTVKDSMTRLQAAAAPFQAIADKYVGAAQRIDAAGQAMVATQQALGDLARNLEETVRSNRAAWEEYRTRFERVDEELGKVVETMQDGLQAHQQQVRNFVSELDGHLSQALTHLSGGVSLLKDSIDDLGDQLARAQRAQAVPAGQ